MKGISWLQNNTDVLNARAAWTRYNSSRSGVVSGLVVSRIENTYALRVSAGSAVINNQTVELPTELDGITPTSIREGAEIFVVLQAQLQTVMSTDRYGRSVIANTYYTPVVKAVNAGDFVVSADTLVLAYCRYSVVLPISTTGPGVVLPSGMFGIYASIGDADSLLSGQYLPDNSTVLVREVGTGIYTSIEFLRLYKYVPVLDPVRITVTSPSTSATSIVSALWGVRLNSDSTTYLDANNQPQRVLNYYLNEANSYFSSDVPGYANSEFWGLFQTSPGAYPTHQWALASLSDDNIEDSYPSSIVGVDIAVDSNDARYSFIRPVFTAMDSEHRAQASGFGSHNNPHGLDFDAVGNSNVVIEVPKQLFDIGFGVARAGIRGVVGDYIVEAIAGLDVQTDFFGTKTGLVGNRYLATRHVPTGVSFVQETTSGFMNSVPYYVENSLVCLGTDFVGGTFDIYPVFSPALSYSIGYRVRALDTEVHLFQCISVFVPGSDFSACFTELFRQDIRIGYFWLSDFEYSQHNDNRIYVHPNDSTAVITAGHVLNPTQSNALLSFNVAQYKGIVLEKTKLLVDAKSNLVGYDVVVDTADLGVQTSSNSGLSIVLPAASQLKVFLANAPANYSLVPPSGTLKITSAGFHGHVFLYYTYGVKEVDLYATSDQVSSYRDNINMASAQIIAGANYVPRDLWEYSTTENKITISPDAYDDSVIYQVWRLATESPRNISGVLEVVGTAQAPDGTTAQAMLNVFLNARVSTGDSITISVVGSTTKIVKTAGTSSSYSGFVIGADEYITATNIAEAFNTDPVFASSGMTAQANSAYVVFTSGVAGTTGNNNSLTVVSPNSGLLLNSPFSGGTDHVWEFTDLAGLGIHIQDIVGVPDDTGYFSLWATGNVDSGHSSTMFHRVLTVDDDLSGNVYGSISASSVVASTDTQDTSTEIGLTLQITGTGVAGTSVQETIVLNASNFCWIQNYRVLNPYRSVRSANQFSSVTSWAVLGSNNIGSSRLFVVAENASGTQDLFPVCEYSWTGDGVLWMRDARNFTTALNLDARASQAQAEALSNVAALLQLGNA